MSWVLKGLNGPLKDMLTPIKAGMTLGRQGDLLIQDAKASSLHARIVKSGESWSLEDNNSKNGVRVNGVRVAIVDLVPGATFQIGDQVFLVYDDSPPIRSVEKKERTKVGPPPVVEDAATVVVPAEAPTIVVVASPKPPEPLQKQRKWNEHLVEFLETNIKTFAEAKRNVAPLEPAVVLDFVKGTQSGARWVLGYGPRKIGTTSLDLPIWEPGAPALCFELLPSPDGIVFRTSHPDIVTVNGHSVDNRVLHVGDTIRIIETTIEVDFIE